MDKITHDATVDFITRYPLTYSLMLPFNMKDHQDGSSLSLRPQSEREIYLRKRVQILFKQVEKHLYGGSKNAQGSLTYFAAIEDKTKLGNPTHIHAHALVAIERDMYDDFQFWLEHHWLRLNYPPHVFAQRTRSPNPNVVRHQFLAEIHLSEIYNFAAAASYMVKQSKFQPFQNVSEQHQRDYLERQTTAELSI